MDNQRPSLKQTAVQLVALDLDGTLMGGDLQISPRVCKAIDAVQQLGVITTLATGRMFSAALPFARLLHIQAPLICYQGGWIQASEGEILHRESLPKILAESAIALGHSHQWHTVLYADGAIKIEDFRYPRTFYDKLIGPDTEITPDFNRILEEHLPDKVLYIAEPEDIPAIAEILTRQFDGRAEVVQSHRMLIEIVPRHVNKGRALAWLSSYLNIPQHAVLAIGDQENDVSMLSWAGLGIAMGNAIPEAKRVADWLAPTLEEDGAAIALERYILRGGDR